METNENALEGEAAPAKKRSLVSIPFLIFAVVILVVGAFGGPHIMTYLMYLQEERTKPLRVEQINDATSNATYDHMTEEERAQSGPMAAPAPSE